MSKITSEWLATVHRTDSQGQGQELEKLVIYDNAGKSGAGNLGGIGGTPIPSANGHPKRNRCESIDSKNIMPGFACCKCNVYNDIERVLCRNCDHRRCVPLAPDRLTGKVL